MNKMMNCAVAVRQGLPAEALEFREVPMPQPGPGKVLVRVEAVGINYADALSVMNEYLTETQYPFVPGMEFAGYVTALGEGVSGVQEGQLVACLAGKGGLAGYAAVPARALVPVPQSCTPAQAAAFAVSYLTAFHGLRTLGHGQAGEWVLVQAAAGALGRASIQLARALDMQVVALASTEEKLAVARALGADVTLLQDDPDRVEKVREAAGGAGVPLILEVVGGHRIAESLQMAADRGRIIMIGNASREEVLVNPVDLMKRNLTLTGLWLNSLLRDPQAQAQVAAEFAGLLEKGHIVPQPGPSYALQDAAQAFDDLLGRRTSGKVIIEPWR
ncbi:NADPH:quinone reductase (plasmid) [Deinococcus proteolyticus MRP]|uniref:NADPH:quinone reductase n=1 Tax=Deinococcus proteolyticus (strain ATCC 35074 / DSM 20540 / JCM 6276 / NBRC 101906 / NCIMB 13154 / VKM Ac-1939 / CCM 2703 / MRP) TaxID=693977 RepID=F0RPH2_DEIPM|nr:MULTISPECIES: NADPH:quinone oxidoreductase family protein [Deinococcus]ADY27278.1 NADPH:quinone reductase [Deinococcus proteolyticus MRP]MCY1704147.1 NADPH:quinone oxidoreductase family protein [Deinococcus sp. SL84]